VGVSEALSEEVGVGVGDQKELDDSTYDEYSARWRVAQIRRVLQRLFEAQPFYTSEDLWNIFSDVPRFVMVDLLRSIVGNKTFSVTYQGKQGYIRYCNGYYVFQPSVYLDVTIPLSIRVGKFPVKRDHYYPVEYEEPVVEDERQAVNTSGTVEDFWRAVVRWTTALSQSAEEAPYPDEIQQRRILMSQGDRASENRYEQILEMILWFHGVFHRSGRAVQDREAFRRTIIFHFWDEWLRLDEQLFLVFSSELAQDPSVMECVRENQVQMGRILVHRFYQAESDGVMYLCENGVECQKSIIDAVERDEGDRLNRFTVTPQTTGSLYGFLISKNGSLTFKTGEPSVDGKVERGQECGIVSRVVGHIGKLIAIGTLLESSGRSDMELNRMTFADQSVRGTTRVCTLLNLFLRFLDAVQLRQRVWFFRPLFARLAGHQGLFQRGRR
jgi:hypothetical protein